MPLYTVYAFIGLKGAKIPVQTVTAFPNDWQAMRELMLEVARKAFNEYSTISALYSLEKHVPARVKVWKPRVGSYIPKPFSHKRNIEVYFHLAYSQLKDDIEIKQVVFAPMHMKMAEEYRVIEKGVKYRIPPIIPQTFKSFLENPKGILQEHSSLRYPDYSKTPRLNYEKQNVKHSLPRVRAYLPWGDRIRESS